MTTNPSIWRIEGNELVEQPTIMKPICITGISSNLCTSIRGADCECEIYKKYIASLRRYPHNLPDSLKGVDLIEGEHFRLQHQWMTGLLNKENREEWEYLDIDEEEYNELGHASRRIIALPISQPEQPKEFLGKTDDLLDCPFCGGRPEWINLEHPCGVPALQCPECQFSMQQDRRDKTWFYWNRRPKNNSEQPISEEGTFTKWLIEGNTIFFIDDLKELVRQVNEKKLMWSKFCEILNMKVFERYHSTPSPSQEAIEFAEWIQIENWRWTATWGWSNEGSGDVFYKTNELYQLYTEHKKAL